MRLHRKVYPRSIIPYAPNLGLTKSISSDPAFVLQGLNLVPFPPSKRDALGAILSSCRDEGKDPALVFSMICYDGKVLCMCQVKYLIKTIYFIFLGQIHSYIRPDRCSIALEPDKKSKKFERFRSMASSVSPSIRRRSFPSISHLLY